jgi:hypothetical protein
MRKVAFGVCVVLLFSAACGAVTRRPGADDYVTGSLVHGGRPGFLQDTPPRAGVPA